MLFPGRLFACVAHVWCPIGYGPVRCERKLWTTWDAFLAACDLRTSRKCSKISTDTAKQVATADVVHFLLGTISVAPVSTSYVPLSRRPLLTRPPLSDADVEAAVGGGSRGMLVAR